MKNIFFALGALALAGCASDYERFYNQVASPQAIANFAAPTAGDPQIRTSTGEANTDIEVMYTEGFALTGYAAFNGRLADIRGAIAQAKKVGAALVVVDRKYTNTMQGVVPLTLPTTNTSYSSGAVNISGSNGGYANGNYSGTTTTYGTATTYIPYSIAKYDQQAAFFIPLKRTGAGVLLRPLTQAEAQNLGTARAAYVRAVRRGSPAFMADILPGDIVVSINGAPIDDPSNTRPSYLDGVNHFVIVRQGNKIAKDFAIPSQW